MNVFDQFEPKLPALTQLHQAICKEYMLEYHEQGLETILSGNAANVARILAELMGEYAQVTHGSYQGFNRHSPLEAVHPHSWVTYLGTICDPLKWDMEGSAPYIYKGESIGSDFVYDEDFRFRSLPLSPPAKDTNETLITFRWSEPTREFLATSIFGDNRDVNHLTREEIYYLTKLPFQYLLPYLPEIYQMLIEHGQHATISKTALLYFHSLPELS